MIFFRITFYVCVFASCVGCSLYQFRVSDARKALQQRDFDQAVAEFEKLAAKEGGDQLVYLLDYAIALQYAGRFEDSNRAFQLADELAEVKDYYSVSRITASLLLSESMVQYKGEDFEKILINVFGAINYLMLGNLESALVETRRLTNKLELYRDQAKRSYDRSVFARYVAAMIWEADGNYDSAYIDYEEAYRLDSSFAPLKADLIRASILAQRPQKERQWRSRFAGAELRKGWKARDHGELILFYQQGWGPVKRPHPSWPRVPKMVPVGAVTQQAELMVDDQAMVRTEKLYSLEQVAIKTMEEAYAPLIAKRIAGKIAKDQVAKKIGERNETLGHLARLAMNVVDQPDLRQWSTLPASIQVARIYLRKGDYQVAVRGLTSRGAPTGERMAVQKVSIRPGEKTFINWRSFR